MIEKGSRKMRQLWEKQSSYSPLVLTSCYPDCIRLKVNSEPLHVKKILLYTDV
jgi:hypothetical protein